MPLGIDESKPHYILYDKGDKDGNRWYLKTPFAISWTKENVRFLKTNSGKKGIGMPVVRNPMFYFKEGFCWSDINTTYLKCRIKDKSINDVKSMSLFGLVEAICPESYIISMINSTFISKYVDNFINNTQTFQINDARQLPIIIPDITTLTKIQSLYSQAIKTKKQFFDGLLTEENSSYQLDEIQKELDDLVKKIYLI